MFSQSIEELRKQVLQHKQRQPIKNMYSLKWLILSKAIQPSKLSYQDIEYELEKNRVIFKQLYMDYQRAGKFMHELDDIIVKDIRRLDQNMILNTNFTSVWPKITAAGFKNCVMIITRIIIRYDMPFWSTNQYNAQYFQGMHEIIAFILFIFINQLSILPLQEINTTKGCISCKLHNIMADTYLLARHVLKSILPLFQDNECLEKVCENIYKYIKNQNDKFFNEIQKQIKELPPIITFAQKSIKLIFLRDFDLLSHMQYVWDYIFAFDSLCVLTEDQNYQFLSFLLGHLYIWRFLNKEKLKINEFINIFLEQNLLFPQDNDIEEFLAIVANNYSKTIDITSMTSILKSARFLESSDGVQSNYNGDDAYNIKNAFEKNKQLVQEINLAMKTLQNQDLNQQIINLQSLCQGAIDMLNNEKSDIKKDSQYDDVETQGRIHTFGDLLGEYRRLSCLRRYTE